MRAPYRAPPPTAVKTHDPRALVKDLKRVAAVAAALAFGGFWALAASHQVGVTNGSSSQAQVRSVSGATGSGTTSGGSSSVVSRPRHSQLSNGGSSGPVLRSGSS